MPKLIYSCVCRCKPDNRPRRFEANVVSVDVVVLESNVDKRPKYTEDAKLVVHTVMGQIYKELDMETGRRRT